MKFKHHLQFWIAIGIILTLVFGLTYNELEKAFFFVSFLMPVAIATSYFFNYFLVPVYLLKGFYVRFFIYLLYTIIVSLYLEMMVVTFSFIVLANYNIYQLTPMMRSSFTLAVTVYCVVFIQATILLVNQLRARSKELAELKLEQEKNQQQFLTVRSNRQNHQLKLDDISHIESLSDYLSIYFVNAKPITTKETISSFQEMLPSNFLRIHRSFIINMNYVTHFSSTKVNLNDVELTISRSYKEVALNVLQANSNESAF